LKIYEAMAHALQEEGIDTIFGLMGDGNLRFLTYWATELEQGYYGTRHESAAVAMADGYARVSGKVGVATVTQGPGVTNTLTALVTARKARTPMLLMVGDVASFQSGWPQDVNHDAVFAAAEVPLIHINNPKTAYSDVVKALRLAEERRGPVGLNMPTDMQEQEWNAWDDETEFPAYQRPATTVAPDTITQIADVLTSAKRPAIIAGRGAVEAGCTDTLTAIGDQIGAVFATTLRGKGAFGAHPYSVGVAGGLGSNLSATILGEADVVLVVGASLNAFTMMNGTLLGDKATIIRIDERDVPAPADHQGDLMTSRHIGVVADADDALKALAAELEARNYSGDGYRPRAGETLLNFKASDEFSHVVEDGAVDPRTLVVAINELLPDNTTVVTDAGHFFGYPVAYVDVHDGRSFVCGIDFGSIGLGIGHAMGAGLARPEQPTVLFVGDGGLLMSLGDVETAIRYNRPLVIFVLNDAAYGSELQIIRMWELAEDLSVFPATDFASITQAMGARVIKVRTDEDIANLAANLGDLNSLNGVTVVDCTISQNVRAAWLEEAFRH
jgi:acetolactate synthase-1/2/3 large subunit